MATFLNQYIIFIGHHLFSASLTGGSTHPIIPLKLEVNVINHPKAINQLIFVTSRILKKIIDSLNQTSDAHFRLYQPTSQAN